MKVETHMFLLILIFTYCSHGLHVNKHMHFILPISLLLTGNVLKLWFSQTFLMTAVLPSFLHACLPNLRKDQKLHLFMCCQEMEHHRQHQAEWKFWSKWFVIGSASLLWILPLVWMFCSICDYRSGKMITRWISINWIYDKYEG